MFKLGILGCGCMAQALAKGITKAHLFEPHEIVMSDVSDTMLNSMKNLGFHVTQSNIDIVKQCDNIIIAVKPHIVKTVLTEINPFFTKEKLLISICAGIPISTMETYLSKTSKIIRAMPNTCCLLGQGVTCFALSSNASNKDKALCQDIFSSVGVCMETTENLLCTITAVSGSGPAYVYVAIEAMADAGVKGGLPRDIAIKLAAQTVLGAATMVLETKQHPAILKDQVSSPGGTTICGTVELENKGFRAAIIAAVEAARKKALELES